MVATKIRLLDEAKPEAAEAAAIEVELAAKGLHASNTTLADCLAATSDLDLGGKWGGDAERARRVHPNQLRKLARAGSPFE